MHRIALVALAALVATALFLPGQRTRAIPFFHVVGDSDGDHIIDGSDPQPAVFCGGGHADNNSSGSVTLTDVTAVLGVFNTYPLLPGDAFKDQNHNDAGDIMDLGLTLKYVGTTVATACTSMTASPMPVPGLGATSGPEIAMTAPASVAGGMVGVTVSTTNVSPSPFIGYFIDVTFDPSIVNASSASNLVTFPGGATCVAALIDNTADANGLGEVRYGCISGGAGVTAATGLASLSFTVVAPGNPKFRMHPFGAPYGPPSLHGTYTIGAADVAPQVQPVVAYGGSLTVGPVLGYTPGGIPALVHGGPETVTLSLAAPAAGPLQLSFTGTGCASPAPPGGLPMALVSAGPPTWVYSVSMTIPVGCVAFVPFEKCLYVESPPTMWSLVSCVDEVLLDPSGYVYPLWNPSDRLEGASVTLERFDGLNFVPMDPVADSASFLPNTNPEMTISTGQYAWDVAAGTYRVTASYPTCTTTTSMSVIVPPPVTTLNAGLPCSDTDGDNCADYREVRLNHLLGGDRDPAVPWDFFDVPVPVLTVGNPGGTRNRVVSIADVIAIVTYIGTFDNGPPNLNGVDYDTNLNGNGMEDGQEYDRNPSMDMSKPWRSSVPNGAVSIGDALVALNSVGDNCS